jgi:uroporphyrinogen decarboxylase
MVEGGGSSDDWRGVKSMVYSRPDLMHRVLAVNAEAVAGYLNAQIDAGAQAVMVFDSWGGALADRAFQEFSLAYTRQVLAKLKRSADGATIPRIVFTKGGGLWLEQMEALDCDVLGVDWTVNLARARAQVGRSKALQGNLDPAALFAPPERVAAEARRVLEDFGMPHTGSDAGPTHIFNLGHGISQHTPPEHVQALVEAVHAHSARMRGALPKS